MYIVHVRILYMYVYCTYIVHVHIFYMYVYCTFTYIVYVLVYPSCWEVLVCSISSSGSKWLYVSSHDCTFISLVYLSNIHLFILCTFIIVLHNLFMIFFLYVNFSVVFSQFYSLY